MMDIFTTCQSINNSIIDGDETSARNELIRLLDHCSKNSIPYNELINSLIRQVGLYPYLDAESSSWTERFVFEAFKADVGLNDPITLHREQSALLKRLLDGESLAVSAPTSFGKSFVIDAFISIKKPKNVVIIVPTIALTDETRRRLNKKYSDKYRIVTTADAKLSDNNIFIFPQERASGYVDSLKEIDILIIDEFYKASPSFDKERSPTLLSAILKLSKIAKQRYFLAPNIKTLNDSLFTKGMAFVYIDFNTVYLEKHELYREIKQDEIAKSNALLNILNGAKGKSLIYAGTYSNIEKVALLIAAHHKPKQSKLLNNFSDWLSLNYDPNWNLTALAMRGTGIHNGQLHRSLSQIQIRLFEESSGLKNIISTSSIIEGINTSAENVILWSNLSGRGRARINDFSYKNIIGRGGRMLKHFVGKVYVLEEPPQESQTQLDLGFPDELIGSIEFDENFDSTTFEQRKKSIEFNNAMDRMIGDGKYQELQKSGEIQSSNADRILNITKDIYENRDSWNGLRYLNSSDSDSWDRLLYRAIRISPSGWDIEFNKFVSFVKILEHNWARSIPELLNQLNRVDISVNQFFKLERNVVFKLSSLFGDINVMYREINPEKNADISSFISKLSHAFLPKTVYQLEEYGLPRMISRKIHQSRIFNFEDPNIDIHDAIEFFSAEDPRKLSERIIGLSQFEQYFIEYFHEGIKAKTLKNSHNEPLPPAPLLL